MPAGGRRSAVARASRGSAVRGFGALSGDGAGLKTGVPWLPRSGADLEVGGPLVPGRSDPQAMMRGRRAFSPASARSTCSAVL